MKRLIDVTSMLVVACVLLLISGCGVDEATVQEIARREVMKTLEDYKKSFKPEKFNFGIAWEKEFSLAQGVKTGNLIFLSGQLSCDTEIDENGLSKRDLITGKNFEEQLRQTLENMKAVLENYDATMDDVVFLQHFVDPVAGKNKAGDYLPVLGNLIREYFPNGLQGMTCVEVSNLFGPEQLIESNAIAVVNK